MTQNGAQRIENRTFKLGAYLLTISLILVVCASNHAAAQLIQRVEIPSSPQPLGSGARALGIYIKRSGVISA